MLAKMIWVSAAVGQATGAAARSLGPEATVYTGPRAPVYAISSKEEQHRRDSERQVGEVVRFQSEGQALLRRMQADPNFGGLLYRHLPHPHAIVRFTGDAEARLKRYTNDPRYHVERVDMTLAELERWKDDMAVQLHYLGLRCFNVDGDEEHNRVTVTTAELDKVRAAISEGRLRLPPKFAFLPGGCDTLL